MDNDNLAGPARRPRPSTPGGADKPGRRPILEKRWSSVNRGLLHILDLSTEQFRGLTALWPVSVIAPLVGGLALFTALTFAVAPALAVMTGGVTALILGMNYPWVAAALLSMAVGLLWTTENWPYSPTKLAAGSLVIIVTLALVARKRLPRAHWTHLIFIAFALWNLVVTTAGGYEFFGLEHSYTILGWAACVLALNQVFRGAQGITFLAAIWVIAMTSGCVVVLIISTTDNMAAIAPVDGDVNDFAVLALMGFFLGLGLALERRLVVPMRLLFGACAFACLVVVVGSMSRGAWLALALGMAAHFVARPRQRRGVIGALAGSTLLAVMATPLYLPGLITAWTQKALVSDDNVNTRLDAWIVGLSEFAGRPLTGTGIGTISFPYSEALTPAPGMLVLAYAHNTYVEVIYGTGLIGSVLFVALMAYVLVSGYRAPRLISEGQPSSVATWLLPTAIAVYTGAFTVTQVMYAPMWVLLAMAVCIAPHYLADDPDHLPRAEEATSTVD